MTAPSAFLLTAAWVTVFELAAWVMVNASIAIQVAFLVVVVKVPALPSGHFTVAVVTTPSESRVRAVASNASAVVHS